MPAAVVVPLIAAAASTGTAVYQQHEANKRANRTKTETFTPNIVHPLDYLDNAWRAQQGQQAGRLPAAAGQLPTSQSMQPASINSVAPPSTPTSQYYTDLLAHIIRLRKQNEAVQQPAMMSDPNGINAALARFAGGGQ